ncbi:putative protease YdcP precursor [Ruminiclostridium hungatei]|uniref:Putative protease YdcP n=1 Tax=Ruminiclostridium hungatei TaxID=48256 RepID=A0A1V4SPR5_RUMHU|nr:U32 family peptidase [Ruminiclostridium hungatei]OPX45852.1 putative protease YdcP precursor [Ruminiclostridium hungatei]
MTKKIELLAPAGNYDAFLAAVENGADAVYMGGKLFNARQYAGNFEDEELCKALDYAHVRGVKIFLALNTLILEDEMQQAVEYAAKCWEMGVDALILQDLGLASNLKKLIPAVQIHASTQMTTYDTDGVRALERMGFERAVLARELSLHEIREICNNTGLDIEVFIHGALCISYSGQCLMSSLIGGRSGNRGRCAQPCRMYYSAARDGKSIKSGYLLSPKDICYIDHLGELIEAGVNSFKIEGRMKNPEYVATVVGVYRKYLNLLEQEGAKAGSRSSVQVAGADRHRLLQSFNRGGFSQGYLKGKTGPEMMAYEKPKNWGTFLGTVLAGDKNSDSVKIKLENTLGNGDGIEIWSGKSFEESPGGIITKIVQDGGKLVKRANPGDTVWVSVIRGNIQRGSRVYKTSDREMLDQAAETYSRPSRKAEVKARFQMKAGELPVLTLEDFEGNSVRAEGAVIPEKAVNKPLSQERVSEQLKKTGSTPFKIIELDMDMDSHIVVPISELNNIRRKAAGLLEEKRAAAFRRQSPLRHDPAYFPGNIQESLGNSQENPKSAEGAPAGWKINCESLKGSSMGVEIKRKGLRTGREIKLSAMLYSFDSDLEFGEINAHRLYIPFNALLDQNTAEKIKTGCSGKEIFAYIPAITKGKQSEILDRNIVKVNNMVQGFLAGNMGTAQRLRRLLGDDAKLAGDYSLNLLNGSALNYLKSQGFTGAALSYELNLKQLEVMDYPAEFEAELGVYGRIPVMTSEYCPVGGSIAGAAPHKCKGECKSGVFHLKDRKNAAFPVVCDCVDCRSTVFNSDMLFAPELVSDICKTGLEYMRLSFVDESSEEIYDTVNLYRNLMKGGKTLHGHEKSIIENTREKGITRGHLQRGV